MRQEGCSGRPVPARRAVGKCGRLTKSGGCVRPERISKLVTSDRPAASSAPELMRDPEGNCCRTVCGLL